MKMPVRRGVLPLQLLVEWLGKPAILTASTSGLYFQRVKKKDNSTLQRPLACRSIQLFYWRIETDGPRGGLLPRPAKASPAGQGTNAFVCSIEVPDFDAIAKKNSSNGLRRYRR